MVVEPECKFITDQMNAKWTVSRVHYLKISGVQDFSGFISTPHDSDCKKLLPFVFLIQHYPQYGIP